MATIQSSGIENRVSENVLVVDLTTIDAGASVDIAIPASLHKAPVAYIIPEVLVKATDQSPAFVTHVAASDSQANRTARVIVNTVGGGSLSGMTLRLWLHFSSAASGGLVAA